MVELILIGSIALLIINFLFRLSFKLLYLGVSFVVVYCLFKFLVELL